MAMTDPITFDNRFASTLRADPNTDNIPRQVAGASFTRVNPTPVKNPRLIAHSREMASLLGFSDETVRSDKFARVMGGNELFPGMDPFAMNYGGHQFGQWAGQLGDGRAINLGETSSPDGRHWMLQLKGAGPTPYSRTADGRAVLRSSIREFLCSEAMFHLGIPTTRALSLVLTGDQVERDMFYDGHPEFEPGAVVCRVSPTFVRFGSFQIHVARSEMELLRQLADFTIESDFPHLGSPSKEVYLKWFEEVCHRTADMIIHWMRVGFVHGVMNTDNMSILGLTIDYGPYGWVDNYDPDWTPNTTDAHSRRYVFGNQPQVAQWNLAQLARSILPLVDEVEPLQDVLEEFAGYYQLGFQEMMAAKLGFKNFEAGSDEGLLSDLFALLQAEETDMTLFYRKLAAVNLEDDSNQVHPFRESWYAEPSDDLLNRAEQWLSRYVDRASRDAGTAQERKLRMNAVNPKYVLRNYLAQQAIDKSHEGDHSMISELLEVMRNPYDEQPEFEHYAAKRPEWARNKAGCSMLSCSS